MKPARCVTAAVLGVSTILGAQIYGKRVAASRIAAILATHPNLSVADLEVMPLAGTLALNHVSVRAGGTHLTIARLLVPLPGPAALLAPATASADPTAPSPVGAPAAGTIQATDVVFTTGAATVRIKRIELAGTSLSNADLAALLDPKAPDSLEARLKKLTATAVVIPEIIIEDTTAGSERHALIRQVLLANVTEGKASAATAAETSIALTDGQEAVNGSAGALEAAGVDLAQVAHVLQTTRKDESEPIRPLFAKVVVNALKLDNATHNAGLSVATVAATGVSARSLEAAPLPIAGPMIAGGMLDPASAARLSDIARSFTIGTLEVDDVATRGRADGEDTSVAATHIGLEGLGAGKVAGLHMREFKLQGAHAMLAVGAADAGPFAVPNPPAEDRAAARAGQVDLRQIAVEVTPRDKAAAVNGATMRFNIDHVALAQDGGATSIPANGSATIDKLGFDVAPEGTLTHSFYDMGYRRVTLSAGFTSTYDAGAEELTVRKFSVNEPAMGSAEIALRLGNVSQDLLSPDAETSQASAIAVVAKTIDLKLVNAGLFEKAIALKASQDGVSVSDERTYGVDFFANKLPLILGDGVGVKTLGGAVAKFIADPKTLHVSLDSKQGLGVGAIGLLGDPGALLDSLDIRASADD